MAIDTLKTATGDRPDLAALPVASPIGYVGGKVFPTAIIKQKAGEIYFQSLVADAAAQTNRAQGAAPTATVVGEDHQAFSCGERIKRYVVDYSRVPMYGGVPGSDKVGAKAAKRSVLNSLETAQLAALIDAAGTSATSAIFDGIVKAADAVKRYAGDLAFVCSVGQYRWLIQQTEFTNKLALGVGGSANLSVADIMSASIPAFQAMLQGVFGFKHVLVADDAFWPTAYTYTACVCKVPDGTDPESYLVDPELGRTLVYIPDDGSQWSVNSNADDNLRANVYDAVVMDSVEQFNSGAKSLVLLSNATVTTTTTTTTTTTATT